MCVKGLTGETWLSAGKTVFFYFQLLEENDRAHCEQSDKLLATLQMPVNISAVIQLGVPFVFCYQKDSEESCIKGFSCKTAPESVELARI